MAKIKDIHIEKYRGINHLDLRQFNDINVIVGKNNSGKSSLLEAIFTLFNFDNPMINFHLNKHRGYHEEDYKHSSTIEKYTENIKSMFYQMKDKYEKIKIGCKLQDDTELKTEISVKYNFLNPLANGAAPEAKIPTQIHMKSQYGSNATQEILVELYGPSDQTNIKHNGTIVFDTQVKLISPSNKKTLLKEALSGLLYDGKTTELIEFLKIIDPNVKAVTMIQDQIYFDIGIGQLMPYYLMGDGIKSLMTYIAVSLDTHNEDYSNIQNRIILIDEIENGLHYSIQSELWKMISLISKKLNRQFIITTHSMESLYLMQEAMTLAGEANYGIFRLTRDEDGHRAMAYNATELETASELNWEIR